MLLWPGVMVTELLPPRLVMAFVMGVQLTGGSSLVVVSKANDPDKAAQPKLKLPWGVRLMFNRGEGTVTVTVKSNRS